MIEGIYHVRFSSNTGDLGEGVAVFKGDTVNGGDYGYLYTGTKREENGNFTSKLAVKQWNPAAESIFGPTTEFDLELSGSISDTGSFVAEGHVAGQSQQKITIHGKFLSPAA